MPTAQTFSMTRRIYASSVGIRWKSLERAISQMAGEVWDTFGLTLLWNLLIRRARVVNNINIIAVLMTATVIIAWHNFMMRGGFNDGEITSITDKTNSFFQSPSTSG